MKNPTQLDKLWLTTLYDQIKRNQKVTFRSLRTILHKELPREYDPEQIDSSLVRYHGTELTILGVAFLDHDDAILLKANIVVEAIRNRLLNDYELKRISAEEVAQDTGMTAADVGFVLKLISPYGRFWSSASGSNEYYGYSSIGFENDDRIFMEYLYFTNIQRLIEENRSADSIKPDKKAHTQFDELQQSSDAVVFKPLFTSRITQKNNSLCFVLMPFKQTWSDQVFKQIRTLVESRGMQCLRADNLSGPIIIEDIWIQINQSAFIIADVTDRNPNVMYELGIAHTIGTPVILLTQDIENIPFDFKHLRHIRYQNVLDGWKDAEQQIIEAIHALRRPTV